MRMSQSAQAASNRTGAQWLLVAMALALLMSACSSATTDDVEGSTSSASDGGAIENERTADESTVESTSGNSSSAGNDSTSWEGPEWIDYPPGYEMTFSFPIDPDRGEGAIYGAIPDPAALPAALDQVLASFEANGYTIRQVRGEYAEVFDSTGSVVLLSTRQFDDPPSLNMVFLSPEEAANRGILARVATLEAVIGEQTLTASGGCTLTETGSTFVSVDGAQSIGFSERADGTQLVQVLLTASDGVDYTTSGGEITAPDQSGFTISSGVIGAGGELLEAVLTVDCG